MSFLRRAVAVLAITLLASMGAGELWSIEIDCIEGRPWDSGSVEVNGDPKQRSVFKKDPSYRIVSPKYDESDGDLNGKSFDRFLSNLITFLNP